MYPVYRDLGVQVSEAQAKLNLIFGAARRLSLAASELQIIDGLELSPEERADAWKHAYSQLQLANEAFRAAIGEYMQLPAEPSSADAGGDHATE